jgi:hypothetical protein
MAVGQVFVRLRMAPALALAADVQAVRRLVERGQLVRTPGGVGQLDEQRGLPAVSWAMPAASLMRSARSTS